MTRDSLARELSPEFPCVSVANTDCKTIGDFSDMPSGSTMTLSKTFQECRRFFSTFECQSQRVTSPAKIPKCITRISNECGIEKHATFEAIENSRATEEVIPMPKKRVLLSDFKNSKFIDELSTRRWIFLHYGIFCRGSRNHLHF